MQSILQFLTYLPLQIKYFLAFFFFFLSFSQICRKLISVGSSAFCYSFCFTEDSNTGFIQKYTSCRILKDVSGLSYWYATAINPFEEIWICQQRLPLCWEQVRARRHCIGCWGNMQPGWNAPGDIDSYVRAIRMVFVAHRYKLLLSYLLTGAMCSAEQVNSLDVSDILWL